MPRDIIMYDRAIHRGTSNDKGFEIVMFRALFMYNKG